MQINMILEVIGRPPKNVQEGLKALSLRLNSEQGVKIISQTLHPVIALKEAKNLYTTFGEFTLELDSLANYFGILFAYMPANVEIIYPEKINLNNQELNFLGNRLLQRLHDYDAIAKKMIIDRDFLLDKIKEISPNLFKKLHKEVIPQEKKLSKKTAKGRSKK